MLNTIIEEEELKYNLIKDYNKKLSHCMIKGQVDNIINELLTTIQFSKDKPELQFILPILYKLVSVNCKNRIKDLS